MGTGSYTGGGGGGGGGDLGEGGPVGYPPLVLAGGPQPPLGVGGVEGGWAGPGPKTVGPTFLQVAELEEGARNGGEGGGDPVRPHPGPCPGPSPPCPCQLLPVGYVQIAFQKRCVHTLHRQ
jgi:hypothetical protein